MVVVVVVHFQRRPSLVRFVTVCAENCVSKSACASTADATRLRFIITGSRSSLNAQLEKKKSEGGDLCLSTSRELHFLMGYVVLVVAVAVTSAYGNKY